MIDSKTKLCLSLLVCTNGLSYSGEEIRPTLCIKRRQTNLVSDLLEQINISCYTEYKAFGPSLNYNIKITSNNYKGCKLKLKKCVYFTVNRGQLRTKNSFWNNFSQISFIGHLITAKQQKLG